MIINVLKKLETRISTSIRESNPLVFSLIAKIRFGLCGEKISSIPVHFSTLLIGIVIQTEKSLGYFENFAQIRKKNHLNHRGHFFEGFVTVS